MIGTFTCRHPIGIQNETTGLLHNVRCNRCVPCILRRKQLWSGRCILEWLSNDQVGTFATLTYDNNHYDERSYKDVQLFLKRLRHLHPVRFYAAPDLGGHTGRFHWHLLLFGIQHTHPAFQPSTHPLWHQGDITDYRPMLRERISYTTGYVTQKLLPAGLTDSPRMSNGIGRTYIQHLGTQLATQGRSLDIYPYLLTIHGRQYPLDATCRKWLKQSYIDAGGAPGPKLDFPKPYDPSGDAVTKLEIFRRNGGLNGEKVFTRFHAEKQANKPINTENRFKAGTGLTADTLKTHNDTPQTGGPSEKEPLHTHSLPYRKHNT